jgi:hypothetical protein
VNGIATLSETSIGVCVDLNDLPQGPVVVLGTQFRVTSE